MELTILVVFIVGYLAIALEHPLKINKAAAALITGVLCWTIYIFFAKEPNLVSGELIEHLGDIAGILFFLMGAMTIVELIDAHDGFQVITSRIKTDNKRKILWIITILTFFLSAVLDNLTTAIVMTSLSRKLISDRQERMIVLGMVIIASNAGGVWSPIGDVTTTMLWIGGRITANNIILKLFIPSVVCTLLPLLLFSLKIKGTEVREEFTATTYRTTPFERRFILATGIGALLFVPVFKTVTHLPPFMGILLGLGILWILTEIMHLKKADSYKSSFSVVNALQKIDTPSILFFLGILVAVAALQSTGMLSMFAVFLLRTIDNENAIVMMLGLLSAIIDNVPLVAAAMGMYDLTIYPVDHFFWEFLAYCTGTGGSALIIGSAAGVAVMGMEQMDFFWYVKRITLYALLGYVAGALVYIAMEPLFSPF